MKHPQNSHDAASLAPQPRQKSPLSARRTPAPTLPAAPQPSPQSVFPRTPSVAIAQFLIDATAIRNHRNPLKTITRPRF